MASPFDRSELPDHNDLMLKRLPGLSPSDRGIIAEATGGRRDIIQSPEDDPEVERRIDAFWKGRDDDDTDDVDHETPAKPKLRVVK